MLKCTINGKEMTVKPGTTIIEAMRGDGQNIAHYCWHPGLSVAGVCRLCMVEIQGNPRPQIACNTQITDGMVINNTSEKVKDSVKWGLDFHLINHPLDCPICDQAGECGLQDQYMEYGKYDPEMAEKKVKKHKVVDLGEKVVLDSERCILCSRCVRFTDEVSKTNELGIFNRGDRAEIGTFDGKPLNNKYSVNTVDICPVGALTSKDFRFRQRVWLLKDAETVCQGCSTGCNVKIHFNKQGVFRVKPVYNEKVNGHWMCDEGRDVYKFLNKEFRLLDGRIHKENVQTSPPEHVLPHVAVRKAREVLAAHKSNPGSVALVLTGQYTVEEYESLVGYFKNDFGSDRIFHWINNSESFESFDGLLLRGDRNPNTKGLLKVLEKHGVKAAWKDLSDGLASGAISAVVVAGPENQAVFPDMKVKATEFSKAKDVIWFTACKSDVLNDIAANVVQVPTRTFFEKAGTFINHAGLEQKIHAGAVTVPQALSLHNIVNGLAGRDMVEETKGEAIPVRIRNEATMARGTL